jgi:hypothetical protein
MRYFLRQARRSIWTGEAEVTEERRARAVGSFARRDVDTDGVSVYAIKDERQMQLVVANYACAKKEHGTLDLLTLEDDEVTRFGAATPAFDMAHVRPASALHYVLDWTPEQLAQLVKHLLEQRRAARRFSPREVLNAVLALDPQDVVEGEHREWVLKLKGAQTS